MSAHSGRQLRAAALGICAAACGAGAQTPEILREHPTASTAAVGGAGVALVGTVDARLANPALVAGDVRASLGGGATRAELTDVVTLRAGLTHRLGGFGDVSVDVRQRRVEDLVEDSLLAADPGLQVNDVGMRLGYARRLLGDRVRAGAAVEHLSSTVFGTSGEGWTADAGVAFTTRRLDVGVALNRVGPSYRWRDAVGSVSRSEQGRSATAGARWKAARGRLLDVWIAAELQRSLDGEGEGGVRAGGEVTLGRRLSLRAGASRTGMSGGRPERRYAAGLGLRAARLRLDLARDRIGGPLGQRTLIDLSLER